jgi:hypothetical protein
MRQASLIDALIDPRLGSNDRLSKIDALIDWAPIEALAKKLRPSVDGRPPYPALVMVKALYLQALYDLERIQVINHHARRQGVEVIWVHPPIRRD